MFLYISGMIEKAVKHYLKKKGWTQGDLAKRLNVTQETVSRQLRGNPTLETLQKIAVQLDINIIQLFSLDDDPNSIYGFVEYLGETHKIASKKDLEKILSMMD